VKCSGNLHHYKQKGKDVAIHNLYKYKTARAHDTDTLKRVHTTMYSANQIKYTMSTAVGHGNGLPCAANKGDTTGFGLEAKPVCLQEILHRLSS